MNLLDTEARSTEDEVSGDQSQTMFVWRKEGRYGVRGGGMEWGLGESNYFGQHFSCHLVAKRHAVTSNKVH